MAAQWWELAIPAGATLGGVGLTIAGQLINGAAQRKSERRARFLVERREAYSSYVSTLRKVRRSGLAVKQLRSNIDSLAEQTNERGKSVEALNERVERMRAENAVIRGLIDGTIEAIHAGDLEEARRIVGAQVADEPHEDVSTNLADQLQESVRQLDGIHAELESIAAETDARAEEVERSLSIVMMHASQGVRLAALVMAQGLTENVADEEYNRREARFIDAARKEFGV